MAKTMVVATQKGGVGKTTTVGALAAGFGRLGYRVLVVDMDPQCNLSFSMGADFREAATIYHVLRNEVKAQFAVQHTAVADIIPSSFLLSGIELEFTGKYRQYLLRQALSTLAGQYDYIFIDTPPGLGILTANALVAAKYILIPCLADSYSLHGLVQLNDTLSYVKGSDNPGLEVAGVVITQVRPSRLGREMQQVAQMVCQSLQLPLLKTQVRASVALAEAQNLQCNILEHARRTNGGRDYIALVQELQERGI